MNRVDESVLDEAVRWHLASARDDMDWDGFTHWLEADPAHVRAYDEVALSDDAARRHANCIPSERPAAANDDGSGDPHQRRRWPIWAAAALAASVAALVIAPQLTAPAPVTYSTSAHVRTIALDDGSRIELAPRSRLTMSGRDQARIALEGGAYFDIVHDPSRELAVDAGGVRISDIGTRFDVLSAAQGVRVAVEEGTVSVSGKDLAAPIVLPAGRAVRFDFAQGTAQTTAIEASAVGQWRTGRLTFQGAPLRVVAAELARYAGAEVTVSPSVSDRLFSGTLVIRDGDAAIRDLARLMDLPLSGGDGAWRLGP